jgi:hypothetical protein
VTDAPFYVGILREVSTFYTLDDYGTIMVGDRFNGVGQGPMLDDAIEFQRDVRTSDLFLSPGYLAQLTSVL